MSSVLALRSFGVAFGDQVVLRDVTFDLPETGLTVLVGPAGCGKSTLLRTLAGLNDCHPSLVTWGTASFGEGSARGGLRRPALVTQHARFFLDTIRENLVSALPNRSALAQPEQVRVITRLLEASGLRELSAELGRNAMDLPLAVQRRLAILRALVQEPRILFADEPTAGLEESDAIEVIATLRAEARSRAVLLVTHHQRLALAAGGTTLLLAGGRIQERAPTRDFFTNPQSDIARHFLRTGGCVLPASERPSAAPTHRDDPEGRGPVPAEATSRFVGPRGFFWVIPGLLGGLPRPGIIDPLERDLAGLARLSVRVLVTLEESRTVDATVLESFGIRLVHFPVPDMGAPDIRSALSLCRRVQEWTNAGEAVAFHCRAGLGRTGTLLAAQVVFGGESARGALEAVRAISPRSIQSTAQVEFLRAFEAACEREPRVRDVRDADRVLDTETKTLVTGG
jgi:atypical dual specificity phosphatase